MGEYTAKTDYERELLELIAEIKTENAKFEAGYLKLHKAAVTCINIWDHGYQVNPKSIAAKVLRETVYPNIEALAAEKDET